MSDYLDRAAKGDDVTPCANCNGDGREPMEGDLCEMCDGTGIEDET